MAEPVVSYVVEKLGNFLKQEVISLHSVEGEIQWLNRELGRMQCFLKDADVKRKGDARVKNWVKEIRDVAYEAEDIIDTFMLMKPKRQRGHGFIKRYVLILHECIARRRAWIEIQGIKERIREISENRIKYGIIDLGETEHTTRIKDQALMPFLPHLDDTVVVGFDIERKKIMEELLDKNNKSQFVISIVGMGGLGKTTLAKSIFNDINVKRSFSSFAWVTISQKYDVNEIMKNVWLAISGGSREETSMVIDKLLELLMNRKYLIVLDDVWSRDVWHQFKGFLPDVNNGSRVIITTRSLDVARSTDSIIPPHELAPLNEQESWELFLRKAFPKQDVATCCPDDLIDLGRQLVRTCGGLPLAVVAIGGLVSTKEKNYTVWEKFWERFSWQSMQGAERCLEILASSYNDLPYYLKPCFLYFGSFPEDHKISAQRLIWLWTAEGFVPSSDRETMEETGEACLEELVQRCMVQVVSRKYDGSIKECQIHDLLRQMCISEAKECGFFHVYTADSDITASTLARRLMMYGTSSNSESLGHPNPKLRTLLAFQTSPFAAKFGPKLMNNIIGGSKFLRVIDLCDTSLEELPNEINFMIHLRFLGLRSTRLKKLPTSISNLCNLQTLDVRNTFLREIPNALWNIESLRHVYMSHKAKTGALEFSRSKNLQSLRGICAGPWIENELPKLTNLRKLRISKVSVSHSSALSMSLNKLDHLASLTISKKQIASDIVITSFSNNQRLRKLKLNGGFINQQRLPSDREFPPRLMKLKLVACHLEQDPMPTLEKLPHLRVLYLSRAHTEKQMTCSAGGFPQLEELSIVWMEVEDWKIEKKAMPHLRHLRIQFCWNLKMIPQGLRGVTTLEKLELFLMAPQFLSRIAEKDGEDRRKIQHVPEVIINGEHVI